MRRWGALGLLLLVGATVWSAGCRKEEALPPGQTQPTQIVCIECRKTATLALTKYAGQDTWPKECPSCHKPAAYACTPCSRCGKPVPMKDAQTGGYGVPATCPNCGKRWEL